MTKSRRACNGVQVQAATANNVNPLGKRRGGLPARTFSHVSIADNSPRWV